MAIIIIKTIYLYFFIFEYINILFKIMSFEHKRNYHSLVKIRNISIDAVKTSNEIA
jgi:hypothetical protein